MGIRRRKGMIMEFPTMEDEILKILHDEYNRGAKDFQATMVNSFSKMDFETVSKEDLIKMIGSVDTNILPVVKHKDH